jgi:hypothetical protein
MLVSLRAIVMTTALLSNTALKALAFALFAFLVLLLCVFLLKMNKTGGERPVRGVHKNKKDHKSHDSN